MNKIGVDMGPRELVMVYIEYLGICTYLTISYYGYVGMQLREPHPSRHSTMAATPQYETDIFI